MLPSSFSRARFATWPDATSILVYDADASVLAPAGNLLGLMRKFRAEGFPADRSLVWLKGGFHAVWRERPDLVDKEPLHEEEDDDDAEEGDEVGPLPDEVGSGGAESAPGASGNRVLRTRRLPIAAFTSASTQRTSARPSTVSEFVSPNFLVCCLLFFFRLFVLGVESGH